MNADEHPRHAHDAVPGRREPVRVPRLALDAGRIPRRDGWPTNAVHGFARFLLELLERERPRHIAIAFDEALDSCFRNALYPAYKANREPAPEELKRQFAHCKALCARSGWWCSRTANTKPTT
jgi:5'-3' exonuclease